MVDDVGAEELATDANNVGPVEPRMEVVVVAAVVAAVVVTTSRKSIDPVQWCWEHNTNLPIITSSYSTSYLFSNVPFKPMAPLHYAPGTSTEQNLEHGMQQKKA